MEETLGKRIVANRKRLGLTQDQLAEQLGVTAQAVSKWENDQSCPDITILPKLAEIFGISTDALLGHETAQPVFQGEVVDKDEDDETEDSKSHWEFTWNGGRKNSIAFGLLVLLTGALALGANIQGWDVSFWSILWPGAILVFGLVHIYPKFSFSSLCCTLFGGYYLASNLNLIDIQLGGKIIIPVSGILLGISLLADAMRKPKKPKFTIKKNGKPLNGKKTVETVSEENEHFSAELSFGEKHWTVTLPRVSSGSAQVSFGELIVDLTQCKEIADGCTIDTNCSFGELVLLVPSAYHVEAAPSTSFGSTEISGHPNPNPVGTIYINSNVSFGEIEIRYK